MHLFLWYVWSFVWEKNFSFGKLLPKWRVNVPCTDHVNNFQLLWIHCVRNNASKYCFQRSFLSNRHQLLFICIFHSFVYATMSEPNMFRENFVWQMQFESLFTMLYNPKCVLYSTVYSHMGFSFQLCASYEFIFFELLHQQKCRWAVCLSGFIVKLRCILHLTDSYIVIKSV